jgi:hypothetical protein
MLVFKLDPPTVYTSQLAAG